jgi:Mat/Ecp fimbriae major subunit
MNAVGHSGIFSSSQKDQIMINKMKLALAGAVIATGMVSNAAYAATEQANATVDVLAAVQINVIDTLDFGVVAASAAGGTVTIGTGSNTPTASGVTAISGGSRGSFQVTQATNGETIALSASNPTPLTSGANSIVLSGLALSTNSIVFNSASLQTVYVGGTISLGASQPAGNYTGTFDVTADYQ